MSKADQLQDTSELGSFELEVIRYRPKDMDDFSHEYFKSLQADQPLKYYDTSGLIPFVLEPTDESIIERLQIPQEDLEKVEKRRSKQTYESKLEQLNQEIKEFTKEEVTDILIAGYTKYKIGVFKVNEFLSFLAQLYKVSIEKDQFRIYYTKVANLTQEEKQLVFKFLEADYKIQSNVLSKDWKAILETIDKMQKHTYHFINSVNPRLEELISEHKQGKSISLSQAEEVYQNYSSYLSSLGSMTESQIYDFLLGRQHFEREIIFNMSHLKHLIAPKDNEESYRKIETVYSNHFERLTYLDYFNFVLMAFIPLLKPSVQTSIEHKEMESFLNHFSKQFNKIITINFPEEKEAYYNYECVKYFLNKENTISNSKYIMIDIIQLYVAKFKYLTTSLAVSSQHLKKQFDIIKLQLNEFYKGILDYCKKVISISTKYEIESDKKEALIQQFKSKSKQDQTLILSSLKMMLLFEESSNVFVVGNIIVELTKALSIQELTSEIKTKKGKISKEALDYYNKIKSLKDLDELQYISFIHQCEIISMIVQNKPEMKNTAMIFDKTKLIPYIEYNRFTNEVLLFSKMYYSLKLHKDMEDECTKDIDKIKQDFTNIFTSECAFISNLPNDKYEEEFRLKNRHEQKMIIVIMMFFDNLNQLKEENRNIINTFTYFYLKPIALFVSERIVKEASELKDEKLAIDRNKLYLNFLMKETKDVMTDCYVYYSFDRSFDFFSALSREKKEICLMLLRANKATDKFYMEYDTNSYSIEELVEGKTLSSKEITEELQKNRKRIYEYIEGDYRNSELEIELFSHSEKQLIIKRFNEKKICFSPMISANAVKNDDILSQLKKILISMKSNMKPSNDKDVQLFYCKQFFKSEFRIFEESQSLYDIITSILENPYDKANKYLKESFKQFNYVDQSIILLMVLIKSEMTNIHTQYYEDMLGDYILNQLSKLNRIVKKYEVEDMDFIVKEADYLLKFFPVKMELFLREIMEIDSFVIHSFTREFSSTERTIMLSFMELFFKISKKEKYHKLQWQLDQYKNDMDYNTRIDNIITQLNEIISNKIPKYSFIGVASEIKESFNEIDYFIEFICGCKEINSTFVEIFKSFSEKQRTIVLLTLDCLVEQEKTNSLLMWKEELEKNKTAAAKQSIFIDVINRLSRVKGKVALTSPEDKRQEGIKEYNSLKLMFDRICSDLFEYSDNCSKGIVNKRKLKAIEPIKHKVLAEILEIEYILHKNKTLKEMIDYIQTE